MDKTILITRPKGEEQTLVNALHGSGYRVIHEPMMEVLLRHNERYQVHDAVMSEPDAVLVTSRHGVQALSILTDIRDMFIICVGESTARTAMSCGFTRTTSTGGNAQSMIDHILSGYDEGSRFLYISGDHVRVDLSDILGQHGMLVERVIAYETPATQDLSDTLVEQIRRKQVDGITFLSHRTAGIFMELAEKHDIEPYLEQIRVFCMSEAIADSLAESPWRSVHVAHEPTLASLVNSIDNVFLANG